MHNCCVKVANASNYRRGFERYLVSVFEHNSQVWMSIEGKMKSESFKQKVMSCVRAWEDWAIYPNDYLVKLQSVFLGLLGNKSNIIDKKENEKYSDNENNAPEDDDDDVDGKPLEEYEQEEDNSNSNSKEENLIKSKFVSSKWETVDPDKLEKQAITTSRWDFFDENDKNTDANDDDEDRNESDMQKKHADNSNKSNENNSQDDDGDDDDIDGKPMDDEEFDEGLNKTNENIYDEEKRKFLREIEVINNMTPKKKEFWVPNPRTKPKTLIF